jgi:hypothetical protein
MTNKRLAAIRHNGITRLTAQEREAWKGWRVAGIDVEEPIMGSLEERLALLVRAHGGRVRLPGAGEQERERYRAS